VGAGGYLGAIFERDADARVSVRLRLDELSRFSPDVTRMIPRLVALAERHMLVLPLRAGQGYILNNSRWLHGRMRFSGTRTMFRVLGNPLPDLAIRRGFIPPLLDWGAENMHTPDAAENACCTGEQVVLLTRLADELGGRADGWSSTLAPTRGRPVLEVVSLATRRGARVVAEAGSLWWWPQVVEIGSASDVSWAATQVAAVLGVSSGRLVSESADRRAE